MDKHILENLSKGGVHLSNTKVHLKTACDNCYYPIGDIKDPELRARAEKRVQEIEKKIDIYTKNLEAVQAELMLFRGELNKTHD